MKVAGKVIVAFLIIAVIAAATVFFIFFSSSDKQPEPEVQGSKAASIAVSSNSVADDVTDIESVQLAYDSEEENVEEEYPN